MIYLSWAAVYEGPGDAAYYDVLLPRLIEDVVAREGTQRVEVPETPAARIAVGRTIGEVAKEVCRNAESFRILFVHADTGGRGQKATLDSRGSAYCREVHECCGWPIERCVVLRPRHETEAWIMADPVAVMIALGLTGDPARHGLPRNAAAAEALPDAKHVLAAVLSSANRRRRHRVATLFARVAQSQRLDALRDARSFQDFEADLRRALVSLGCLPPP